MDDFEWDIRREGGAWQGREARERYELTPEKLEMFEGLTPSTRPNSSVPSSPQPKGK